MPEVAGSGFGSEGWQMLFRSPVTPPPWQRVSRLAMSPMPGTEQIPPEAAGCRAAVVTAVTGGADVRAADAGAADALAAAETAGAAVAAGVPAPGRAGETAAARSTQAAR